MNKFKLRNIISMKAVEPQLRTMFEILKDELIDSEEYHIVLFLLSLYKDGIISTESLLDMQQKLGRLVKNYAAIF